MVPGAGRARSAVHLSANAGGGQAQSWGLLRAGSHSSVGLIAGSLWGGPAAEPGPGPRGAATQRPLPARPGAAGTSRASEPAAAHRPRHGAQAQAGPGPSLLARSRAGQRWESPLGDRPAPPAAAAAAGPGLPRPWGASDLRGPAPPKASAPGVRRTPGRGSLGCPRARQKQRCTQEWRDRSHRLPLASI